MTDSPFGHLEALRVGTVGHVSPSEVRVELDSEAPSSVALNTGSARPFPRVNEYVLVSVDDAFLACQVEWLTMERANRSQRGASADPSLIDLPVARRHMSTVPVGTLRRHEGRDGAFQFRRGADSLPSIGSAVLLASDEQLHAIVESGDREGVPIGTSPLASDAVVRVNPDRLFGRHLAVLGNTGSGKSCSVAGLIRWSLEAAREARQDGEPNARFVILDPNGEYARAFSNGEDHSEARVFRLEPSEGQKALKVPLWFWNSLEWASFMQAKAGAQLPLLRRALREIKVGGERLEALSATKAQRGLRRYLSSSMIRVGADANTGSIRIDPTKFGNYLRAVRQDLEGRADSAPGSDVVGVCQSIDEALAARFDSFTPKETGKVVEFYRAFTESDVRPVLQAISKALEPLGGLLLESGPDEDAPLPFAGADLADHLELLALEEGSSQWVDPLVARIRARLSDQRINAVLVDEDGNGLQGWLEGFLGADGTPRPPIAILDLSLVPSEVVHVLTAVAARMIFEALQRYRKLYGQVLPTVLVMEEAHTFVRRHKEDAEGHDAGVLCCRLFERIAREGRKFGLGLVLSSQRPSELSPTVLSQCNTFLLHRISNDKDQDLVARLLPDSLRGLLRELPTLPSQHAVLLGWASELPILTRMRDLPKGQQPHSDDPDFWAVWTGRDSGGAAVERDARWEPIVREWQGREDDVATGPNEEEE